MPRFNKYTRILKAVFTSPWAILPEKLESIVGFLEFAAEGNKHSKDEVAALIGPKADNSQQVSTARASSIAVISIRGIISQKVEMMDDISGPGGTSTERVMKMFRLAITDETIKAVVLDIDSPGGTVYGVEELATEIYKSRGKKPIVSMVNSLAASAAYWIGAAADEIVITPGGEAGSVGVYMMHVDESKALDAEGVKVTFVQAGEFKTEANPYEPLTDEARAYLQSRVDDYYSMFTRAVAKYRGVSVSKVKSDFGKGRVFGAEQAVSSGMADRIATFDQTIERLAGRKGARADHESSVVTVAHEGDRVIPAAELNAANEFKSEFSARLETLIGRASQALDGAHDENQETETNRKAESIRLKHWRAKEVLRIKTA